MAVGLGKELDAPGLGHSLEALDDLRRIDLELVEHCATDREGDAELALELLEKVEKYVIGGQVACVRQLVDVALVGVVVIIVVVVSDIEESVSTELDRLV